MTRGTPIIDLHAEAPQPDGRQEVHLLPVGRFSGVDGRGPYEAKESDLAGIVEASRRESGRRQMVIDYHHATDLARRGGEAPARRRAGSPRSRVPPLLDCADQCLKLGRLWRVLRPGQFACCRRELVAAEQAREQSERPAPLRDGPALGLTR